MLSVDTEIPIQIDMTWYTSQLNHYHPPPPPYKKLIGFGQFVWAIHFWLRGAQAPPSPPMVAPLLKSIPGG